MARLARKGVTARLALESDLDAVVPLLRAARAESPLGAQLVNPDSETVGSQLHDWFRLDGTYLVVAEVDDAVVGVSLLQVIDVNLFSDVSYVQIEALYVDHAHRRRGIGRALMSQLAVIAARNEAERVVTMPLTGARSEQRFLSGLGFGPAGSRRITETAALLRRLEQPSGARERRVRGIDELIARRRRSRGLPETPPRGLSLVSLAARVEGADAAQAESSSTQVKRDVQTRRPDSSATAIS